MSNQPQDTSTGRHQIRRVRHEIVRRTLKVASIEDITPRMRRVRLRSDALTGFSSQSPDDHIKLFLGEDEVGAPSMRDFTPRHFDAERNELTLDFALHLQGPATLWASSAKVGDVLDIGGPRGSLIVPEDFDWYLLVGDESALPAIGRWVEEMRAETRVTTVVSIADESEKQVFSTKAAWTGQWAVRGDASEEDGRLLREALSTWQWPEGEGFVWIAGEDALVRDVRAYVIEERGHPSAWMKTAAYWHRGRAPGKAPG